MSRGNASLSQRGEDRCRRSSIPGGRLGSERRRTVAALEGRLPRHAGPSRIRHHTWTSRQRAAPLYGIVDVAGGQESWRMPRMMDGLIHQFHAHPNGRSSRIVLRG